MTTVKDVLLLVDKVSAPLKKITESMKKTVKESIRLKERVQKLNETMKKLQPTLNRVWSGIMRFGRAVLGLVGSSGILTMGIAKVTEFADNIDKMSQKIGMSTDEYQKWNYIMSINGGNVDSLAQGFKTLTTQIEGVQKGSKESIRAFRALGVRVKDNNGKFRSQEDIFNDTVSQLQKITDTTKRAMLGQKLFGRSYLEMRPVLNQNAEAMAELVKQFEKYGLKLSKEEIQNAVKFKDTWTTFTMFLQARTNKALTQILPKLQEILDKIMKHKEAIERVIKALGELIVRVFKIIDYFAKHKGVLAFILGIVTALGVMTLWSNIVVGLGMVAAALTALGIEANIALGGIPLLLGLIAGAVTAIATNWGNNLKDMAKAVDWLLQKLLKLLKLLPIVGPALDALGADKAIAGAIDGKVSKNSVQQTQIINNDNSTHNETKNFGHTFNGASYGISAWFKYIPSII